MENPGPDRVRIAKAMRNAAALVSGEMIVRVAPARPAKRTRIIVGDPQAPAEKFFGLLDLCGLLGEDGWLAPGVELLSVGDHFDYGKNGEAAALEGLWILHWLSAHPANQVRILLGNHDAARVMELVRITDAEFVEARALARKIDGLAKDSPDRAGLKAVFAERFPDLPTPGLASRDYSAFSAAQRTLVRKLLLQGRYSLACVATLGDTDALVTHAGVTRRELSLLGVSPDSDAKTVAASLNSFLHDSIKRVRPAWERGEAVPLDLGPLHVPGTTGQEGGGLLYHRPANPVRGEGSRLDVDWAFGNPAYPRRFDPRNLPMGLVQVCGHSPHKTCAGDLGSWAEEGPATTGDIRTLTVVGGQVRYVPRLIESFEGVDACMLFIDGKLADTPIDEYAVLAAEGFSLGTPPVARDAMPRPTRVEVQDGVTIERYPFRTSLDALATGLVEVAGFEGGAIYMGERDGRPCVVTDEGTMADFLDEDDDLLLEMVTVRVFPDVGTRDEYLRQRAEARRGR